MIAFVIAGFAKIIRPLANGLGFLILIILGILWFALMMASSYVFPFLKSIWGGSSLSAFLSVSNILLVISIPIVLLILFFSKILFKNRTSPYVKAGLGGVFILSVIGLFFQGSFLGNKFNKQSETKEEISLANIKSDTLTVFVSDPKHHHDSFVNVGHLKFDGGQLISTDIRFDIKKAKGNEFRIIKQGFSRGGSSSEARGLIDSLDYNIDRSVANTITLPSWLNIPSNNAWRNQHLKITLEVPVGKYLKIGNDITEIINDYDVNDDDGNLPNTQEWKDKVLKMTDKGIICPEWQTEHRNRKKMSYNNFSEIQINGEINAEIEQTNNNYGVELKGDDDDIKQIEISQTDNILYITTPKDFSSDGVKIKINLPKLDNLLLQHTGEVAIHGFKQDKMKIVVDATNSVKAFIDVANLNLTQEGEHSFDLRGKGKRIKVDIENSNLDARGFDVKVANIRLNDAANAKMMITDTLYHKGAIENIKIDGSPIIIDNSENKR